MKLLVTIFGLLLSVGYTQQSLSSEQQLKELQSFITQLYEAGIPIPFDIAINAALDGIQVPGLHVVNSLQPIQQPAPTTQTTTQTTTAPVQAQEEDIFADLPLSPVSELSSDEDEEPLSPLSPLIEPKQEDNQ